MAEVNDTLGRISEAVRGHETQIQVSTPEPEAYLESQPQRWMRLTTDLPAATWTTVGSGPYAYRLSRPSVAAANPVDWQLMANGRRGGYAIDATLVYYVQEATGNHAYRRGDVLLCRALATAGGTVWEPIAGPSLRRRGSLLDALFGCGSALAAEIDYDPSGEWTIGPTFTVFDPLNKTGASLLAVADASGNLYLPAGTCFDSTWRTDSQRWELDEPGACCGSGSGGSESGSGSLPTPPAAECGVPCPPAGCAMEWVSVDVGNGKKCRMLVCCESDSGSSSGSGSGSGGDATPLSGSTYDGTDYNAEPPPGDISFFMEGDQQGVYISPTDAAHNSHYAEIMALPLDGSKTLTVIDADTSATIVSCPLTARNDNTAPGHYSTYPNVQLYGFWDSVTPPHDETVHPHCRVTVTP